MSELESVRIQFLPILEEIRKCQNWKVSELEIVRIFILYKYVANDAWVTIVIQIGDHGIYLNCYLGNICLFYMESLNSKKFWPFPILTLSDSDTFQIWHFPILTLSNSDTFRFWHFPILTLSDTDTFQFWRKMHSDTFQFWHFPVSHNYSSDGFSGPKFVKGLVGQSLSRKIHPGWKAPDLLG